jgi:hypothetical protein
MGGTDHIAKPLWGIGRLSIHFGKYTSTEQKLLSGHGDRQTPAQTDGALKQRSGSGSGPRREGCRKKPGFVKSTHLGFLSESSFQIKAGVLNCRSS